MSPTFELAIAIPTYNRAAQLGSLLVQLAEEVRGLSGRVVVMVANNCSTDATAALLADYVASHPGLAVEVHQHERNLGAIPNIEFLVRTADAQWVWCLGDDDLLAEGAVRRVLDTLPAVEGDLLLVRTTGIPEWDAVPRGGKLRQVTASTDEGAQCLISAGFLASVVFRAETWRSVLAPAASFGAPNYANWAAALLTASRQGRFALLDSETVRGNANMVGAVRFEKYGVLVLQRLLIGRRLGEGDAGQRAVARKLRPLLSGMYRRTWRSIAGGSDRSLPQPGEKLRGFADGARLLGWRSVRALPWLILSLLLPHTLRLNLLRLRNRAAGKAVR